MALLTTTVPPASSASPATGAATSISLPAATKSPATGRTTTMSLPAAKRSLPNSRFAPLLGLALLCAIAGSARAQQSTAMRGFIVLVFQRIFVANRSIFRSRLTA